MANGCFTIITLSPRTWAYKIINIITYSSFNLNAIYFQLFILSRCGPGLNFDMLKLTFDRHQIRLIHIIINTKLQFSHLTSYP